MYSSLFAGSISAMPYVSLPCHSVFDFATETVLHVATTYFVYCCTEWPNKKEVSVFYGINR